MLTAAVKQVKLCIYLDEHTRLVVRVGGKGLGLLSGNGGVTLDQDRHHTSSSLNTKRQRSDIQKQQVLHILRLVPRQDGCLDSCKSRHSKIYDNC